MADIPVKVSAFAGAGTDESPRSFSIGDRSFDVVEVCDRWYGDRYDYFELLADDGYDYILRRDREEDRWELVMMEKAQRKG